MPEERNAKIEKILENMRQHLREALDNQACKGLSFTYELNHGGVRRSDVTVTVQYHYVNSAL